MSTSGITVRSTPEAVTAIEEIAATLNGPLLTHFDDLRQFGKVLTDPENWDGCSASEFRTTTWPTYERALNDLHDQLNLLNTRLG
nr:hypothetical protein [Micromonospora sp. DSM 115978]